ncbi:MAG: 4Fe-4S dicluster domain-containing protein, partial [Clostridiales bacterium]|nr:4Fe-4S dicluster domain-containing protein [Clostridiales bacterium]
WFYHKKLEEKGFIVKWTYHFNLPNNLSITISPFPYTDDNVELSEKFNKCEKRVEKAAEDIAMSTASYTGNGFGSLLLGLLQRPVFKLIYKTPLKSPYKVIPSKCTICMKCIQICPEGNIKLVDGEITFGRNCTMCLRCYSFCPVSAITAHGQKHKEGVKTYRGPEGYDPALITKGKDLKDFIE